MNSPSLIINADDFGWTDGHNQAVERAHREGILTSTSLMTTTSGFAEALQILARSPELRVGVHLTLNETPPALSPAQLPALTGPDGNFHDSIRAIVQLWGAGKLRKEIMLAEWRAQLELALRAGVPVTRLDSHKHVHLFPPLWDAFLVLVQEYKIPYIRLPLERFSSLAVRRLPFWGAMWMFGLRARSQLRGTGLSYAERFWGFTVSGAFTRPRLEFALTHPAAHGITEIMVHPACITPQVEVLRKKYAWAAEYLFEEELSALIALKKGG